MSVFFVVGVERITKTRQKISHSSHQNSSSIVFAIKRLENWQLIWYGTKTKEVLLIQVVEEFI